MPSPRVECKPVFCQVCGGQIARGPKEQPSIYLRRKFHPDKPECAHAYRQMSAKKNPRKPGPKQDGGQFMIMPVILDRSTNY